MLKMKIHPLPPPHRETETEDWIGKSGEDTEREKKGKQKASLFVSGLLRAILQQV